MYLREEIRPYSSRKGQTALRQAWLSHSLWPVMGQGGQVPSSGHETFLEVSPALLLVKLIQGERLADTAHWHLAHPPFVFPNHRQTAGTRSSQDNKPPYQWWQSRRKGAWEADNIKAEAPQSRIHLKKIVIYLLSLCARISVFCAAICPHNQHTIQSWWFNVNKMP